MLGQNPPVKFECRLGVPIDFGNVTADGVERTAKGLAQELDVSFHFLAGGLELP